MLTMKMMIVVTMLAIAGAATVITYTLTVNVNHVSEQPRSIPFGSVPAFDHRGMGY